MKLTIRATQAFIVWGLCHSLCSGSGAAQGTNQHLPRQVLNLNTDGEFLRSDHPQGTDEALREEAPVAEMSGWKAVHLPHTPQVEPKEFKMSWQAEGVRYVRISLSKVTPSDSRLGIREVELYRTQAEPY